MRSIEHQFEDETLLSEFYPAEGSARATIVIFPTVAGISPLEQGFASDLNAKGCDVFLADLYGKQYRGASREVGGEQMKRLRGDRESLARRLVSVVETVRDVAQAAGPIVAIGFCFGGLCALDLARTGADIAGAASFHGLFEPPGLPARPIAAKVIAFHGWDDPMVPPAAVVGLGEELTRAGCDWQILALGGTRHGFTNPGADKLPSPAVAFSKRASDRAWRSFAGFLEDCLAE